MLDLLYTNDLSIFEAIKKKWPDATWEDASDEMHDERISVRFAEDTKEEPRKDYYELLLREGCHGLSFLFQLAKYEPKEWAVIKPIMEAIIEERKKEKAHNEVNQMRADWLRRSK